MHKFSLAIVLGSLVTASCAWGQMPQGSSAPDTTAAVITTLTLRVPPVLFNEGEPLAFEWKEADSVAVWSPSTALTYYHLISGAGTEEAVFDGPALEKDLIYYTQLPGIMPGDTLKGHTTAGNPMVLEHSATFLRFQFQAAESVIRLGLLPTAVVPSPLSLPLDSLKGPVSLLQCLPPQDWSGQAFAAIVVYANGSLGTARLEGCPWKAGEGTQYSFEPIVGIVSQDAADIPVTILPQQRLNIEHGQYSGITHIDGLRYAVVHDKSSGGGIHFFSFQLDENGIIGDVLTDEAPGNAQLSDGMDNEGIVYVPENQTLFVSAESDQSIREYTLEGNRTGRSLAVPEDLLTPQGNAGFEALGYGYGRFWTVTEQNLSSDDPCFLRLQSFDGQTLQPAARYFYWMDAPLTSSEKVASASAYVHGVPAVTVLDDGRLVVLEREVYVPGGGMLEKALGSITRTTLYIVDPLHDKAGFLQKSLLARFNTGALNLANFEGMCLGPQLEDGRRPLLLIADSQGGMDGLTAEYMKVLLLGN